MADVFTPELTFGAYQFGIMTPTAPAPPYRTIRVGGVFEPSFTLTNVSANTPGPRQYLKNLNTYAWDSKAVAGPYLGNMAFTCNPSSFGSDGVIGLSASSADFSNVEVDYCIYYSGSLSANTDYTNGVAGTDYGAYLATDTDKFRRVGGSLIFSRNGVDLKTWSVSAATPLYFIISLAVYNSYMTFVQAETL